MSDKPDAQTVREIAEEVANIALHDSVHVDQWISAVVNSRFGNECSQFRAPLHTAVARRMATVKPSWPDEQPAAEQDGDEAAGRVTAFLDRLAKTSGDFAVIRNNDADGWYALGRGDLRAVLAGRKQLAARVAELEAENARMREEPAANDAIPECPACGRTDVTLTKTGRMRSHSGDIWIGGFRQICKGVGELPKLAAPQQPAKAPCCNGPHAGWIHTAECSSPQQPARDTADGGAE
ncbi:MAG: hypothetical protein HOY79_17660 [Streptomyces sp.]|nr:hypothetical protein [Streptomyces sp.]